MVQKKICSRQNNHINRNRTSSYSNQQGNDHQTNPKLSCRYLKAKGVDGSHGLQRLHNVASWWWLRKQMGTTSIRWIVPHNHYITLRINSSSGCHCFLQSTSDSLCRDASCTVSASGCQNSIRQDANEGEKSIFDFHQIVKLMIDDRRAIDGCGMWLQILRTGTVSTFSGSTVQALAALLVFLHCTVGNTAEWRRGHSKVQVCDHYCSTVVGFLARYI